MDNEKLLTIAIPTYNGANTISNMLEILLPQCDERVEILISDNASTCLLYTSPSPRDS